MSEFDYQNNVIPLHKKSDFLKSLRSAFDFNIDFRSKHGNVTVEPLPPTNEWGPGNPCFECKGGCCSNMSVEILDIAYIPNDTKFGALEPYVNNPSKSILREEAEIMSEGVYYTHTKSGKSFLTIRENCPGLNEEGGCKFHDQARPMGCSRVNYGDIICMSRRNQRGLSLIPDIE